MVKPKVKAELSINCGCGFKAKDGNGAAEHCATTGHQLTVHGVVRREDGSRREQRVAGKAVKR